MLKILNTISIIYVLLMMVSYVVMDCFDIEFAIQQKIKIVMLLILSCIVVPSLILTQMEQVKKDNNKNKEGDSKKEDSK